ncbi:hypothetical protein [Jannaschia rubra]|uniref:hypothetical protein n=1 Tax=Jannaschia rubra TaxID=282197 RepID=UPI002492E4F7|nr:hypothetical protein [Jannaschia rubra]
MIRPEGDVLVCTGPDAALPQRSATPGTIDTYRPLFRAARWEAFREEIHRALRAEGPPFDTVPPEDTAALCDEVRAAGYRREAAVWNVVRAAILARRAGADLTDLTRASRLPDDDLSASEILYSRARALAPPET